MSSHDEVRIVGGGLAGTEAAFQLAKRDVPVALYEMRPIKMTEAHKTAQLAELVCSNSLKSESLTTGSGLLKAELMAYGSVLLQIAHETRVPAGTALAVDRVKFADRVEERLLQERRIRVVREELECVEPTELVIIASGPLTSSALSAWIEKFLGHNNLYFFDAISPIVDSETIDSEKTFLASRYDKGDGPYLNCPLTEQEFLSFWTELVNAEVADCHDFDRVAFFEGCLPVEEVARRGQKSLAFGAMKPVGLINPKTKGMPYAVVQLRAENLESTMYGMVGFQTRLRIPEQRRVFRMIPGLEKAEFLRYGSVHRNSFVNAPACLLPTMQSKKSKTVFFAGQLCGVEGYVESMASGLLAGVNAARFVAGKQPVLPPGDTALGSLCTHISAAIWTSFQPMNFNFGLLPSLSRRVRGRLRRKEAMASRALDSANQWWGGLT
ncbi:MAG: tRNA (uracil-5-)-methyltransferase [Latescibacteria bacterium DG_63]|nr:MAG: tRNA (uracil-5-)-methyltransferase [Latescibacteria bacterium DG_63]